MSFAAAAAHRRPSAGRDPDDRFHGQSSIAANEPFGDKPIVRGVPLPIV
jgi:hypothetical protein